MGNVIGVGDGNELIAVFMGLEKDFNENKNGGQWEYLIDGYWLPVRKMKYHTSWDWLMPVVEKINKDGKFRVRILFDANGTNGIYGCYIDKVEWINNYLQDERISGYSNIDSPIESVYKAIVKFIKWYNLQNTTSTNS